MKTKLPILLTFCCTFLLAQTANSEGSQQVVKIVHVRGNAEVLASLAGPSAGVHYQVSNALRAIVLRGGASEVANVERIIQELDTLPAAALTASSARNVELTTYVIGGSAELDPGTQEVTGEALAPVVKQLRAIFPYAHYQLLSTMLVRSAQTSKAGTEGMMKSLQQLPDRTTSPIQYRISFDSASISADNSPSIHLANFRFSASVPIASGRKEKDGSYLITQIQQQNIGISTDVDIREGQRVVVGNANVASVDICVFLVLSARLMP